MGGARLELAGLATTMIRYRNRIEVYVGASDMWRRARVAQLRPLDLSTGDARALARPCPRAAR